MPWNSRLDRTHTADFLHYWGLLRQADTSWQRRLNENTNGLLWQFFPKGADFARTSHRQVTRAENLLNKRSRLSLGYQTLDEVFN